ncbi:MAG: tetratricopeptide repeat protein [Ferruginibacter sp.]
MNSLAKQYPSSSLLQEADMETALTYIADEKFGDAVPYLNKVIASSETGGLKPRAYLKLGLAYFNNNDNKNALTAYQKLIQLYPQSAEAAEALGSIKDIYVEEGKPDEYIELMRQNGVNVSVTEADSLSYTSAYLKYEINDCAAAINGFNNYLSKYANGSYAIEANYFKADCYQRSKDWTNALAGFDYVNSRGVSRYFEKASLEAARISYFELKDYTASKKYFESLRKNAASQDIQLEALRGLVRTYYQLKDYTTANEAAKELLNRKGISTDDKAIAFLVLGKSQQVAGDFPAAISSFKSAAAINKAGWGAEARYEMASCHFSQNNLGAAEKAAMSVIKETGSYDWWVTSSYILLGDIFMKQKDYFNAKATYESVARNAANAELKAKAQQKFDEAVAEEKQSSKISN